MAALNVDTSPDVLAIAVETGDIERIAEILKGTKKVDRAYEISRVIRLSQRSHYCSLIIAHLQARFFTKETLGEIASLAIFNTDLQMLEFLKDQKYEFTETNCYHAVQHNSFISLQWLKSRGYPWNDTIVIPAIYACRLNILVWVTENGLDWREYHESARNSPCKEIAEWAKENLPAPQMDPPIIFNPTISAEIKL